MKTINRFEVGDKVRWNGTNLGKEPIPKKLEDAVGEVIHVGKNTFPVEVKFENGTEMFYHEELELVE